MRSSSLLSLALAAATPSVASAWWSVGHMATAAIARNTMSSAAYTAATGLVSQLVQFYPTTGHTVVEAAVWADDLKAQGVHQYDTWHYVELATLGEGMWFPVTAPGNTSLLPWAIQNAASEVSVANNATSLLDKAVQLRFLLHLVGDTHQPLHAASMWSNQFPTGDEGGNLYPISFTNSSSGQQVSMNLHGFMDSMGGIYTTDLPRPLTSTGWATIDSIADTIMANYPQSSFPAAQIAETNPWLWAEETHALAVKNVYASAIQSSQGPLSSSFVVSMQELCQQQVALGGYRLAALLERIFSNSTIAAPSREQEGLPIFRESQQMKAQSQQQPLAAAAPAPTKVLRGKAASRPAFKKA